MPAIYAKGHAEHDEQSRNGMYPVVYYHENSPLLCILSYFVKTACCSKNDQFSASFYDVSLRCLSVSEAVSNADIHICVLLKSSPESIIMFSPEQVAASIQQPVVIEFITELWTGIAVVIRGRIVDKQG